MAGFDPQGEDTSIRDSLAMRQLGTTVSPKKIDKALKPYKLEDTRVKGRSDTQLYNMAETAVVKWWQRQQRAKINSKDLTNKQETQSEKKLDNKVERALGMIPELNLRAQARQEERAKEARQQMYNLLKGTGLRDVHPPIYAMTSVANLKAWINRQVHRRAMLKSNREDYLR